MRECGAITTWDIELNESLPRRDLHERYGGGWQSGITSSRSTPNVFIFSNPQQSGRYGYNFDGWADAAYHYTGEGQVGDQQLTRGNKMLADHKALQRAVRLFHRDSTAAIYWGQFDVDSVITADGPDRNGDVRSVLVFRLLPVGEVVHAADALAPPAPVGITNIPIEAVNSETFVVTSSPESIEAQRREALLVKAYETWLVGQGHQVGRQQITPPGEVRPITTDLYDHTTTELVEAKSSNSRQHVRMALGQVLDYVRYLDEAQSQAVLLPSKPRDDLIALLNTHDISCVWQDPSGTFERADPRR